MYGRDRVVWYANPNFDASQVPPEWHQWLHRMTDRLPSRETTAGFAPKYEQPHQPNLTGTANSYSPKNFIGNQQWTGYAKSPIKPWVAGSSSSSKDEL